jgi:hypothetical protein
MRRLAFAVGLVAGICLLAGGGAAQARCSLDIPPPTVTHRAPPAELLSRLAVLRRPQQPGDIPAFDFKAFPYHLLARDYIRKLGSVGGTGYYLIPGSPASFHVPRRCQSHLSPHQRRVQQRIEREQRKRSRTIGLGMFAFNRRGGGGGGCCSDLHALLSNRTVQTSGIAGHSVVSALVPDGVASVTVRWHRGPERNATVANNFWRVTVPLSAPRAFPHSTIWRDADGHLVKSFRAPGGR